MSIDYDKLARDARRLKFSKLNSSKSDEPWRSLPRWQRLWLIRYYKLRSLWIHLGHGIDSFPRLRDGPIINTPPWSDRYHPVNRKLLEVEELVGREYGHHWRRWQIYNVEYHFITDLNERI